MEYKSLYSLLYRSPMEYQREKDSRPASLIAHSLPFSGFKGNCWYLDIPEIYMTIIRIHKVDKKIRLLRFQLPDTARQQYTKKCLIDELVMTNSIEGVHSTRREIDDILSGASSKGGRFQGLVNKYLLLENETIVKLDHCQDIRDIYNELVLDEVRGEDPKNAPDGLIFRKEAVSVFSETQKEIHRGVYPEEKIINTMEDSIAIIKDDSIDPLIRTALFHYFFGYIHPFYDGNGRTSRFISSYLLSKELDPFISYRLSIAVREDIRAYYKAFEICNSPLNCGDLTPFVCMFLEVIEKAILQLEDDLCVRWRRLQQYSTLAHSICPDEKNMEDLLSVLVQAALFSEKGFSMRELQVCLELSRNTLSKKLATFAEMGLLEQKQIGRSKFYSARLERIDELSKDDKEMSE